MISKGLKKYRLFFLCLMMAPVFSTLTGCARPNDEDMVDMLSKAYQCKWIKVDSYEKTDSLPGIWSYIAQYDFKLRFREGEAGAYKFMKGMYNTVPGETDWQKVLQNPNARAYIRDNCSPPAQKIMERSLSVPTCNYTTKRCRLSGYRFLSVSQAGQKLHPEEVAGIWTCVATR